MDDMVTLTFNMKIRGTHNQTLSNLAKELWDYLLLNGITITVELLLRTLNQVTNVRNLVSGTLEPLEFEWVSFSENSPSSLDSEYRPGCTKYFSSSSSIHSMGARRIQRKDKCLPTLLEESQGVCLSLTFPHRESSKENSARQCYNSLQ